MITFHKVLSSCEEGSPEGWRAFLEIYTPVVFRLVGIHLGLSPERRGEFWGEALGELAANHYERLKQFQHQDEREFLIDLRAFLLDRGARKLDPTGEYTAAPSPTLDSVTTLLKGLPLVHQEVVFLKLSGYSDEGLEKVLRITPTVARQGLEALREGWSAVLGRSDDRCLWPAAWSGVLRAARAQKTAECPPLRQFIRIQEGGFSWYDKEPAEAHLCTCFGCLESWAGLREIWTWRREAQPLPGAEIDSLLASLSLPSSVETRKSLLGRIFR